MFTPTVPGTLNTLTVNVDATDSSGNDLTDPTAWEPFEFEVHFWDCVQGCAQAYMDDPTGGTVFSFPGPSNANSLDPVGTYRAFTKHSLSLDVTPYTASVNAGQQYVVALVARTPDSAGVVYVSLSSWTGAPPPEGDLYATHGISEWLPDYLYNQGAPATRFGTRITMAAPTPVCGNGYCEQGEEASCPEDCPPVDTYWMGGEVVCCDQPVLLAPPPPGCCSTDDMSAHKADMPLAAKQPETLSRRAAHMASRHWSAGPSN